MATDVTATAPAVQSAPQQSLQIEARNLTNLPAPALNIGDIVQLSVRQNQADQAGLVALRGLLIQASLPPNLQPGDKINAQIVQNGDRVIFKIIGDILGLTPKVPDAGPAATPLDRIQNQFQEIFKAASAANLRQIQPEQVADVIRTAGQLRDNMERLIGNLARLLPSGEQLFTPQELIRELNAAATGGQVKILRDLAANIKDFVRQYSPQPPSEPLVDLETQLTKFISQASANNTEAADLLDALVLDLEKSVRTPTRAITRPDQNILQAALLSLQTAQTGASISEETLLPSVQKALNVLQGQIDRAVAVIGSLDQKTTAELVRLAGQIDQLASAQEALERLNPLLQALGEPAMILFPFLFQGLLSHTEVTVYSRPTRRRGEGEEEEDIADGRGKGASQDYFRRIQVSAPLPSLGNIDVDVAVRSKEILVRLCVSDPGASDFLKTRLDELATLLKEQGYERAELFAHFGIKKESSPEWSLGLHALHSLIA